MSLIEIEIKRTQEIPADIVATITEAFLEWLGSRGMFVQPNDTASPRMREAGYADMAEYFADASAAEGKLAS